jgi:hypothetical protein
VIRPEPILERGLCCSGCGRFTTAIHDFEERRRREQHALQAGARTLVNKDVAAEACRDVRRSHAAHLGGTTGWSKTASGGLASTFRHSPAR